jgi:site-specific recombinase XerD
VLRLVKRHLKACVKTSETDFHCVAKLPAGLPNRQKKIQKPRCPFRIVGPHPLERGKIYKENTQTSDERIARFKLLQAEHRFLVEPDKQPPKPAKTLEQAVAAFLNTKKRTSPARQRKLTRLLTRQHAFLEAKYGSNVLVTQPEKTDLDQFVDSWTGALSTRKKDRENLKQFWLYCADSDFILKNIAAKVKNIGTKRDQMEADNRPIPTFTPDEVNAIFETLDKRCDQIFQSENEQDPHASKKTRAFVYVMKTSGLAIIDVVTLRPEHLGLPHVDSPHAVPIDKPRRKTGQIAHTGIPDFVSEMLKGFPPESAYLFWSGQGNPASRIDTYRDRMKKLFVAAGVRVYQKTARRNSGGKLKENLETFADSKAIPHMWRHTLVRDLYIQDIPVREIADILGDDPATVTEYYSQFDDLRRKKVLTTMQHLHQADPVLLRHSIHKH